jgi:sulfate adenylyltransferase
MRGKQIRLYDQGGTWFAIISGPYEQPQNPELELDTALLSPEQSVQKILIELERAGLLSIRR